MLSPSGGHQHRGRTSLAKSFRCSIGRLTRANRIRVWVIWPCLKVTKHHLKLKLEGGYKTRWLTWDTLCCVSNKITFKLRFFSPLVFDVKDTQDIWDISFLIIFKFIYFFALGLCCFTGSSLVVVCGLLIGWLLLWRAQGLGCMGFSNCGTWVL